MTTTSTYWRTQTAGTPLSVSHRSLIGFEEDDLGRELGASVERTYADLVRYAQGGHLNRIGAVDVIKLRARVVGRGFDGEPVVEPVAEIARYRFVAGRGLHGRYGDGIATVAELMKGTHHPIEIPGAVAVPRMEIEIDCSCGCQE